VASKSETTLSEAASVPDSLTFSLRLAAKLDRAVKENRLAPSAPLEGTEMAESWSIPKTEGAAVAFWHTRSLELVGAKRSTATPVQVVNAAAHR
jgi:hypothetical protein